MKMFSVNIAKRKDEYWMRLALSEASRAGRLGEVPVGAVIIKGGKLVAKAGNRREKWQSPLAHAELIAITKASKILKNWRLTDCQLFVTLEPCPMCSGAIEQARFERVVFATPDPKQGAMGSTRICSSHYPKKLERGLLEKESQQMLKSFFSERRKSV